RGTGAPPRPAGAPDTATAPRPTARRRTPRPPRCAAHPRWCAAGRPWSAAARSPAAAPARTPPPPPAPAVAAPYGCAADADGGLRNGASDGPSPVAPRPRETPHHPPAVDPTPCDHPHAITRNRRSTALTHPAVHMV